jgi:hypothetical protein
MRFWRSGGTGPAGTTPVELSDGGLRLIRMSRILLVIVVLVLTGCSAPAELPRFTEPAGSVEEVARQLREFELRGETPSPGVGDVFQLCLNTFDPKAPAGGNDRVRLRPWRLVGRAGHHQWAERERHR